MSSTDGPHCALSTLSIKGGSMTQRLQTEVLKSDWCGRGKIERRERFKNYI